MNYIFRFVAEAVVTVILVFSVVAQAGPHSHPLDEDGALALLERPLSTTAFTRTESLWIVLPTAPKRQPTLIFSLSSAKITLPNAAETPKRVR
jgi:hypothetical protein